MKSLILTILLAFGSAPGVIKGPLDEAPRTRVVMLGTGTPNADPERSGPSLAIIVGDSSYIVDLGPGVVRRAAAASKSGIRALEMPNLKTVFLTHLHSDHTAGFADMMLTPWVLERKEALSVYGPKGVKAMAENLQRAYREDIRIRLYGGEPSNKTGYVVRAHEIQPGVIYRDDKITVKAFRVRHGSWGEAYGYRFETADRTIVVSGDTGPDEAIIKNCNGCDVLIHEVYSDAGFRKRPPEWQKYHSAFHTSASELAKIAGKARPGLLILTHQLFWGSTEAELVDEVRRGYSGRVVSAHDLEIF